MKNPEERLARLTAGCCAIRDNLRRAIVGQEEALELLLTGLLGGGHMLMVGVPGLAKTLMVKTLSGILGWQFRRIQFTPDLMPADITGTEFLQNAAAGADRALVFHRGPVFANLVLADEINRTPPKTQAALLEAMQEHAVTVGGVTYQLPRPFTVVATQNPIEQEGTYPLPEAQLDRFLLSIHLEYPTMEQELSIAAQTDVPAPAQTAVVTPEEFLDFMELVRHVPVAPTILEYAVRLCTATRPGAGGDDFVKTNVAWGVGPRCSQHLVHAARAAALLAGRTTPDADDIRRMCRPVLRHRLLPSYSAMGSGIGAMDIISHVLETTAPAARA